MTTQCQERNQTLPSIRTASVTREPDVHPLVAHAEQTYGRLDIMHNNAGIVARAPVTECDEETWDRIMSVNVKGVFFGCRHAIPAMKRAGGGSIINAGSGASFIGTRESPPYCASKGAVLLLMRQVALDYAADNIRVNAVCPGIVDTLFMKPTWQGSADPEKARAGAAMRHPLGRLASAEEVARAVLWLASDDSSFTTGSALMVDGGYTAQ